MKRFMRYTLAKNKWTRQPRLTSDCRLSGPCGRRTRRSASLRRLLARNIRTCRRWRATLRLYRIWAAANANVPVANLLRMVAGPHGPPRGGVDDVPQGIDKRDRDAEKRKKYDREFREGAVRIVEETGKPVAQVARDLGVKEGTPGDCSSVRSLEEGPCPAPRPPDSSMHQGHTRLGH